MNPPFQGKNWSRGYITTFCLEFFGLIFDFLISPFSPPSIIHSRMATAGLRLQLHAPGRPRGVCTLRQSTSSPLYLALTLKLRC